MTKLAAILNITPDSFSDGGKYTSQDAILKKASQLIEHGANIIDIGAESTRPGAEALSAKQEWQRLENVLGKIITLAKKNNVLTSLDTRHAESAKKAISLGIDWINDVNGLQDAKMVEAVKDSNVKLVMMHSLSVPADKNILLSKDCDPILEIKQWATKQIDMLKTKGIEKERIILDPGIGFGKNAEQSWQIIKRIEELASLQMEILVGHSLKSFLGGDLKQRQKETISVSIDLAKRHVDYLRVHDIAKHVNALKLEGAK